MSFIETVQRAGELLRRQGRISFRALKLEFDLDDEHLEALVDELVDIQQVAAREAKALAWMGGAGQADETEAVAEPASAPETSTEAERRQLTVLFCDLVDSSRLAASLDPEDWREVVRGYQAAAGAVVGRFDGYVAQYLGDGMLVYFGWPMAHEDDAERAMRAGLGIVDAIRDRNPRLEAERGVKLAVRIGIHTGPAVVGEMGSGESRETLAMGETTNVAARLQAIAESNTVVLSSATLRLVQGIFVIRDLGTRDLAGVGDVHVHRAVQATGMRSRLETTVAGLTPFVGREEELMLLEDRWIQVQEGRGQTVLVSGEAGIGKSRLMQSFRERLAGHAHTWLECHTSPYTRDSALYPVLELQRQGLGFRPDDPGDAKLERIADGLRAAGFDLDSTMPLMAALHSVPLSGRYQEPTLSPEGQRQKTLRLLSEWLLRLGRDQPVVLLVEDLHWIDPSTLELLGMVLAEAPRARLLLLATYRPDFEPPWRGREHVTPLQLARLTRAQTEHMIREATRGGDLPEVWVEEIVGRADGVPLFAEELSRAVLESRSEPCEDGAAPDPRIPETLQDSLTARLDALGPAKELAQLGAVLGREFSYDLLLEVSPWPEDRLQRALNEALREELLYQRGTPPHATYLFRHALVRDAAYQSLLRSTRQRHHLRVAETLLACMGETVDEQPELVAHHLTEGGDVPRAIEYWHRAGQRGIERSAHEEAVRHLRRGLALLETRPATCERSQRELGLRTLLGLGLAAAEGYAALEVDQAFARAGQLCRELGESEALFPILFGQFVFHQLRADADAMRDLAERLLALAERSGDPGLAVEAHLAMGQRHYWAAELPASRRHLERVLVLYDRKRDAGHAFAYGQDPAVFAHVFLSTILWMVGRPEEGLAHVGEGVALGQQIGHPFTLPGALSFVAAHQYFRRDTQACLATVERMRSIAVEQRFPMWIAASGIYAGWAEVVRGSDGDGIRRMQDGLAGWSETGALTASSSFQVMLAEACHRVGRVGEGLTAIEDALLQAREHRERYWEAEIHRWKGELLLLDGADGSAVEACFRRAFDTARAQGASFLELRSATSIARLWRDQGKRAQARDLLQPVHGWFTEGFDTQDLKDATALLEELA